MTLSVGNLLLAVGVGFDSQLKAADNLFFPAGVDFDDPTRPMFGGSVGTVAGQPEALYSANDPEGFYSINNGIDGDPITVRQIATADGPRYQVTDGTGKEVTIESPNTAGGSAIFQATPRYVVKSDGIIYDVLTHSNADGSGEWQICDDTAPFGGTGLAAAPAAITLANYARPVGRVTFKAKEGATLARAQDELSRIGSSVQLLVRLLESIQDEGRSFTSIIK